MIISYKITQKNKNELKPWIKPCIHPPKHLLHEGHNQNSNKALVQDQECEKSIERTNSLVKITIIMKKNN